MLAKEAKNLYFWIMNKFLLAVGSGFLCSFAAGQSLAGDLPLDNPSFEEECSTETKIGQWQLFTGAGGAAWSRWDQATGGVVASDGNSLLFTNSTGAIAVQLIEAAPIQPGKYVFSVDAASPAGGPGSESISPRGFQMGVYAIPTATDKDPNFTIIAEKLVSADELSKDEDWKTFDITFEIPAGSPLIGQFFQINIVSIAPAPHASEPAQIDLDDFRARKLD